MRTPPGAVLKPKKTKKVTGRLKEFFAVTISGGLYHLYSKQGVYGYAEKIGGKTTGIAAGEVLVRSNLIGIYPPPDGAIVGFVDEVEWERVHLSRPHTSSVVGLFLSKRSAKICMAASDQQPWDPRWKKQTDTVLKRIGNRHPAFSLHPDLIK